jgi:hypothetical protein
MRKLRYVSDIHLEINSMYAVPEYIVGTEDEDLVFAGDTTVLYTLDPKETGVRSLKTRAMFKKMILQVKGFGRIFFLFGNHEHYHGSFEKARKLLGDFLYDECGVRPDQYIILDNDSYELDGNTVLFGATLWTDMGGNSDSSHYFVGRGMNDFRVISYNGGRFTTNDAYVEHKNTLAWMTERLEKYKDWRVIVATHHAPSFQSEGRYKHNSMITDGYCSNLVHFIEEHPQITDWIHGHTHVNVDYMIGGCHVTSNMRGYIDMDIGVKFDAKTFQEKVIEY